MSSTEKYKCSVIIPSYNSARTIEYTIRYLMDQTAREQISEIIVVDSSDDGITPGLLDSYANNHKIVHINSGVKVIPAIQRNIGAKHAKGKVLLFIDSDAYPEKNWVEKIMNYYEKGWQAGGGGYAVPGFQKNNKLVLGQYYLEFSEFIHAGRPRIKKLCPSCNLFVDRELFMKVGGFPEIRASEDSLLGLKISEGTDMVFIPDALVYHIFREKKDHFYNNQLLLGKYVFIYRKTHYKSFYYKGLWPNILLPVFISFKFLRIYFRIIRSGREHLVDFHKSIFYFFRGLIKWQKGFMMGTKEKVLI